MEIIFKRSFIIFLTFFLSAFLFTNFTSSQNQSNKQLSPRNANYDIDVKLDPKTKTLEGSEVITWTNLSNDNVSELQFHLYLNAFKNSNSTFMMEANTGVSKRNQNISVGDWGWIDINSIQTLDGKDLTNRIKFIQPDNDNVDDQTVISVKLDEPVKPGRSFQLKINFTSKLPKVIARTGYENDFFLIAQWFPKLGVYEFPGIRNATKGGWNCHQFHANSEFYSDFGIYNVSITLPDNFIVGAVGTLITKKDNKDSTSTYEYKAEDVVDFAWTASPHFKVFEDMWNNVSIKILMQPEHASLTPRVIESLDRKSVV